MSDTRMQTCTGRAGCTVTKTTKAIAWQLGSSSLPSDLLCLQLADGPLSSLLQKIVLERLARHYSDRQAD